MNAPVPILLLNYDLRYGGTERQLAEVALHLDRSKFLPHVGSIQLQGGRRGELERAGIPLVEFAFPSFGSWKCVAAARRLARYLRRNRIRLLHTFDVPGTMFGIPVAWACRVPVILSSQRAFRELSPGYPRHVLRLTDRLADRVVVNSANLREHLHKTDRLDPGRVSLIYNSVDLNRFTPGESRADVLPGLSPVIGSTAMLRPEKGVGDLVEAFARIAQQSPRAGLLLVGSGPLFEPLQARIRALKLENRCYFAGGVTDVLPWLRRMDVFVLPSHSEALSNSLLEAMAVGCAVLASRVGGNPELVHAGDGSSWDSAGGDGATGVLFAPGNIEDLVQKLNALVEHERLRMYYAAAGQAFVRSRFSRAQTIEAFGALYASQLKSAGVAGQ